LTDKAKKTSEQAPPFFSAEFIFLKPETEKPDFSRLIYSEINERHPACLQLFNIFAAAPNQHRGCPPI
jgi:hypothetical protein